MSRSNELRSRIAIVPILVLAFVACDFDDVISIDGAGEERVIGSGSTETRQFETDVFDSVSIRASFRATVTQSDIHTVSVTADDNLFEHLRIQIFGNALEVGIDTGISVRSTVLDVEIGMPSLVAVTASGASSASVSGFHTDGQVDVSSSGGSKVGGDIDAGSLTINVSDAARVELEGVAKTAAINGSGRSKVRLDDFSVASASITLNGGSHAELTVSESLSRVVLTGGSRLVYAGNPRLIHVETHGGATIRAR